MRRGAGRREKIDLEYVISTMRFSGFLLLMFVTTSAICQEVEIICHDCKVTDEERSNIQKVAEFETAFFKEVLGDRRRKHKLDIDVYKSDSAFIKAQRRSLWHIISETGVYNPVFNKLIVLKWSRFLPTCYHECSHAIYDHYACVRPTWADEGLAEYFKSAVFDSLGNIQLRRNEQRAKDMKIYVADSLFSIEPVLQGSHRKFHGKQQHYFYSMSWGIVYFFRTQHDDIFKRILKKISKGRCSVRVTDKEYPGGIAQLEKDLIQFYK